MTETPPQAGISQTLASFPVLKELRQAFDQASYAEVPDSWSLMVLLVPDAVAKAEQGRYKSVNFVAAIGIAGVLNAVGRRDLPYVFGGGKAFLLVPEDHLEAAKAAALATRVEARRHFRVQLNASVISAGELREKGHPLRAAWLSPVDEYSQALFWGRSVEVAEAMAAERVLEGTPATQVDFSGIECRWEDIAGPTGESVSLIVKAAGPDPDSVYRNVYDEVVAHYGPPEEQKPVRPEWLKSSFNPVKLSQHEPRVRARGPVGRLLYTTKIFLQQFVYVAFVRLGVKAAGAKWDEYPDRLVDTTDHAKFTGMLQMVVTGTADKRLQMLKYLEEAYQAGHLAYGIQVSRSVLLTCLVFERMGRQVHFADGSGGGYALAARDLRSREEALRSR